MAVAKKIAAEKAPETNGAADSQKVVKDAAKPDASHSNSASGPAPGSAQAPAPGSAQRPRKGPGTKDVPPFEWKLVGEANGVILTLFKAVERDEVEAQHVRLTKDGYYTKLRILDVNEKLKQPASAKMIGVRTGRVAKQSTSSKATTARASTLRTSKSKSKPKPTAKATPASKARPVAKASKTVKKVKKTRAVKKSKVAQKSKSKPKVAKKKTAPPKSVKKRTKKRK